MGELFKTYTRAVANRSKTKPYMGVMYQEKIRLIRVNIVLDAAQRSATLYPYQNEDKHLNNFKNVNDRFQ